MGAYPIIKPPVLEVLKAELAFLEKGGYRQALRAPWRPQFIFEDSPTCINYGRQQRFLPCSGCFLMQFVPQDCREEKIPCRHIPLNPEGYTVDTFYRMGTQEELETAVANWLRETIQRLEQDRAQQPWDAQAEKGHLASTTSVISKMY
ncbi:MAG TPA: hypothetical protein VIX91_25875 [Candidatus Acidoferrum sp.]